MELTTPPPKETLPTTLPRGNEDKRSWCKLGEEHERDFLIRLFNSGVSMIQNPAKKHDKFSHDFFGMFPLDLKTVRTEFRTAGRYGVDPKYAVTLNLKDVERYRKLYPNMIIVFDVMMEHYSGIHLVCLQSLLMRLDKLPIHEYQNRVDDMNGNAKASYVIDCRMFPKLITD